jgi:hypothetical protein
MSGSEGDLFVMFAPLKWDVLRAPYQVLTSNHVKIPLINHLTAT